MKTTKKTTSGGTLLAILSLFTSTLGFAQEKSKFLNEKPEDLIVSGYIVGGVIVFGVIIFVVSKIIAKYSKEEDTNRKTTRSISHRHHHHHNKVIKKSA